MRSLSTVAISAAAALTFAVDGVAGRKDDEAGAADDKSLGGKLRQLKALAEKNREKLKRDVFEAHGEVLTDEAIEALIQDARDRSSSDGEHRWSEGFKPRLTRKIRGLEEFYVDPDPEDRQEHRETKVATTVAFREGVLVSGASPAFPWNEGRGVYWCAAMKYLPQDTVPVGKTPMTLKDCFTTQRQAMIVDYTDAPEYELWMNEADGVYDNWCIQADKAAKGGSVDVAVCDKYDPFQQWFLLLEDDTWRLKSDTELCVQVTRKNKSYDWTWTHSEEKEKPWWDVGPSHRHLWGSSCSPDHLDWNITADDIELTLNDCATELSAIGTESLQPAKRRLGNNKNKNRNKKNHYKQQRCRDRVPQVFIFCFKATVCTTAIPPICTEVESCDI